MTPRERAQATLRIASSMEFRLKKDLLESTLSLTERNEMLAGVLGLVLRRTAKAIPADTDRQE